MPRWPVLPLMSSQLLSAHIGTCNTVLIVWTTVSLLSCGWCCGAVANASSVLPVMRSYELDQGYHWVSTRTGLEVAFSETIM